MTQPQTRIDRDDFGWWRWEIIGEGGTVLTTWGGYFSKGEASRRLSLAVASLGGEVDAGRENAGRGGIRAGGRA